VVLYFQLDDDWLVRGRVLVAEVGYIIEMGLPHYLIPVRFVDMAEDVQFWLYLLHCFPESFAADAGSGVDWLADGVPNAVGRLVGDQDVYLLRQIAPDGLGLLVLVGKAHEIVRQRVRRTEYAKSLHLHLLVHQESADFLEFLNLLLGLHPLLLLDLPDVADLVVDLPRGHSEVVIAGNHYLVLVGQGLQEGPELLELLASGGAGEVASVDEDVGLGPVGSVDVLLLVVGVRNSHDADLALRHFSFHPSIILL
jgi:hypothetical protein